MADHHRLDAVHAHLLERAGGHPAAACCYCASAGKTGSLSECAYLLAQAARLREGVN